jgi:type IV secretory pathway VirB4 component
MIGKIRRQWFAKRKSIGAMLQESLTQQPSALVDNDAGNKAGEADQALQDLGADGGGLRPGHRQPGGVGRRSRPRRCEAGLAEKVIAGRDFTIIKERINAVEAWLGTLPGQTYANVRRRRSRP